ncbi:hypothetical protein [Sphingomonas azotifigens]|uniref:hypothetical protein n=1 Tax=Sphingomonas azotifigens TaxID=330920 RepID=UPI000A0411F5|nr:hypothetical protein [Sphingomonas azotifigens]
MQADRQGWARPRKAAQAKERVPPPLRSDQDLHLWMSWGRAAIPLTALTVGALLHFGVPFNYTPLATIPALLLYLFMRLHAWRRRRAGKRFIHYDDVDVSW